MEGTEGIDWERIDTDRAYRHWITSEVLPSIRKYGVYAMDGDIPAALRRLAARLREEEAAKRALPRQVREEGKA